MLTFHSHLLVLQLASVVLLLFPDETRQNLVHLQSAATPWSKKKLLVLPMNKQSQENNFIFIEIMK